MNANPVHAHRLEWTQTLSDHAWAHMTVIFVVSLQSWMLQGHMSFEVISALCVMPLKSQLKKWKFMLDTVLILANKVIIERWLKQLHHSLLWNLCTAPPCGAPAKSRAAAKALHKMIVNREDLCFFASAVAMRQKEAVTTHRLSLSVTESKSDSVSHHGRHLTFVRDWISSHSE